MAAKLLMKRFAIKDVRQVSPSGSIVDILLTEVPSWMKQFDEDRDGRLSYKEFKHAILPPKEENEPTSVSAVTSSSEPAQIREQGAEIENIALSKYVILIEIRVLIKVCKITKHVE